MWITGMVLFAGAMASGGNRPLMLDGKTVALARPPLVVAGEVYVSANAFARAVHREARVVVAGKLLVLCNDVSCAPVHLSAGDVRTSDGRSYVKLRALAGALGYTVSPADDAIVMTRARAVPTAKRGTLPVGSVLPDVVLTDLAGQEVHLSDYLGRRILICTWASW